MKTFYLRRHFDNTGPYTLEQSRALNMQPQDFIWQVGTKDWVQAKEIEDLNEFIVSDMPPKFSEDNNDAHNLLRSLKKT